MAHLCNIPHLDANIELVERFVRAHKNRGDIAAQTNLFTYYLEKAEEYWEFAKVYTFDPAVERFFNSLGIGSSYYHSKPTPELIEEYDQEFKIQICNLRTEFEQTQRCNIVKICRIFEYISLLTSWFKPSFDDSTEDCQGISGEYNDYTYPLTNDTGIFGLNTYLYAYFHGIHLVGIPKAIAKFDGTHDVPARFMYHDLDHIIDIAKHEKLFGREEVKNFYHAILGDTTLNDLERECHLTNLWFVIHEFSSSYNRKVTLALGKIDGNSCSIIDEMVGTYIRVDFSKEWLKYKELVFSQNNLRSLTEYSEKYPQHCSRVQEIVEFSKNPVLVEYDLGVPYQDEDGLGNYIFMAIWFTNRYLTCN